MPAPALPQNNETEFRCDIEKNSYAPPPPPRVDSFQEMTEEPPLSPFLYELPPAPPLPPLTDELVHNEDPPPIPLRPNINSMLESSAQEFNVQINPPPIPARTTTRPPTIPPRRSVQ